ncbi:MAG: Gfo/Idh/MocA family oxidoreductase [Bacteroidetes bacterium]|nr:Gfo/Idh/MocA family oxidoreductase [Bacteroidota bacterium]
MIKIGLIGAGKMGISHLAILGANPEVEVTGVCDTSKMVTDFLSKHGKFNSFSDYVKMVDETKPEAAVVALPTKFHYAVIKHLLGRGIHVFAEKPFCLNVVQSEELVALAARQKVVNQTGYHNKFIGTFREMKKIVNSGVLGDIYHFVGESYGPVITKPKPGNWRSKPSEGGGCLMDYASHVIDLINDIISPIAEVRGSVLNSIFSENVEDAVYALLKLSNGVDGMLSVNWSDETYRKMSTTMTIIGTQGKAIANASELKVYLKQKGGDYVAGWNSRNITELTGQVDFNLRGEEYTLQLDYFIKAIQGKAPNTINSFNNALHTNRAIELIRSRAN